jgi:hypothetical protein
VAADRHVTSGLRESVQHPHSRAFKLRIPVQDKQRSILTRLGEIVHRAFAHLAYCTQDAGGASRQDDVGAIDQMAQRGLSALQSAPLVS